MNILNSTDKNNNIECRSCARHEFSVREMSYIRSFLVSWGPVFNLTVGKLVIEGDSFSLVPNDAVTGLMLTVGKKAYSTNSFPIEAIIGYENIFMAWMSIILNNGKKVKISVGSKSKKKDLIATLEKQRFAIFETKGEMVPPLSMTI